MWNVFYASHNQLLDIDRIDRIIRNFGFRISDFGFLTLNLLHHLRAIHWNLSFKFSDRINRIYRNFRFRISDSGFQIPDFGFRISDLWPQAYFITFALFIETSLSNYQTGLTWFTGISDSGFRISDLKPTSPPLRHSLKPLFLRFSDRIYRIHRICFFLKSLNRTQ